MMHKHQISAYILTLVTLLLLVAAVLPHHHHETEVCFVDGHCQASGHEQRGCETGDDHEHDLPFDGDNCFLGHKYLIPDGKVRTVRPEAEHPAPDGSNIALHGPSCETPGGPPVSAFRQDHRTACPVEAQFGGSFSLRGPPASA